MAKSIIQSKKECYVCRIIHKISVKNDLDCHHCILGKGNRKIADKLGLFVYLCKPHHHYVHHDGWKLLQALKRVAQRAFEKTHTRAEFMAIIGRNYLDDEE